tara:strand:+ start:147 stop:461 length:315 start_codon:yes stop_codon:yes gene_type:complete
VLNLEVKATKKIYLIRDNVEIEITVKSFTSTAVTFCIDAPDDIIISKGTMADFDPHASAKEQTRNSREKREPQTYARDYETPTLPKKQAVISFKKKRAFTMPSD